MTDFFPVCGTAVARIELLGENTARPSDIQGLVYVEYARAGGWRLQVAKEIKEAGYKVDLNTL
jgi:predicted nucleotide-binding protein